MDSAASKMVTYQPSAADAAAVTTLQGESSRLLDLPAELRNRIYEAVFEEHTARVDGRKFDDHPILRTCKQMRAEARGLYFSTSTFLFAQKYCEASIYLSRLPPKFSGRVSKIDIKYFSHAPKNGFVRQMFLKMVLYEQKAVLAVSDVHKNSIIRANVCLSKYSEVWTATPWLTALEKLKSGEVALEAEKDRPRLEILMKTFLPYFDPNHTTPSECWSRTK